MFSKEESRANNRAVLVSRLFANHPAYPRLTTVFQTSRNNPLSTPLVHFSMKNRNKRRRNTQVAVEIFRIQNFFFSDIFRIIRGNKSFVFSLSLKKLFKEQRFESFVSLSIVQIFRQLFLILNRKNGEKNTMRSM